MKIKKKFDPDKVFFTSDLHLFHKEVIDYCGRPFNSTPEMNKALIDNWNSVVPKDGIVFDLGDMMFTGSIELISDMRSLLNGTIYRCLGNHDGRNKHSRDVIKEIFDGHIYDALNITVGETEFFLSHYPHFAWPRGCYHLYGHVHSGPNSTSTEIPPVHKYRYDVGADNNNYTPISYWQLMNKFKELSYEIGTPE